MTVGTIVTDWFTATLAAAGDNCKPLMAAAAGATVTAAAAMPPVDAAAVTDTLPEATAVTRHEEPDTAAVATAVLLDVQLANVGPEPPVI